MNIDTEKKKTIIDLFLAQTLSLQEKHSDLHKKLMKENGTKVSYIRNLFRLKKKTNWHEYKLNAVSIIKALTEKRDDFDKFVGEVENLSLHEINICKSMSVYLDNLEVVMKKFIDVLNILEALSGGDITDGNKSAYHLAWKEYMETCDTYLACGEALRKDIAAYDQETT